MSEKSIKFTPQKLMLAGSVLCIVLSVILIVVLVSTCNSNANAIAENSKQVEELQLRLTNLQTQKDTISDETSKVFYSATTAGKAVEKAQNEYLKLNYEVDGYRQKADAIADSIVQYFAEDDAYNANEWYHNDKSECTWQFQTTYSFEEKIIDVIWVCSDKDGRVMELVFAKYNAETDKFYDFNSRDTDVGAGEQLGQDSMADINTDKANSYIDAMG